MVFESKALIGNIAMSYPEQNLIQFPMIKKTPDRAPPHEKTLKQISQ